MSAQPLAPWSFNFRHLLAIAAVVRRGSVSAAAGAVHLTQPAVTQGIARVETLLGVQLFERRTDGMTPLAPAHALAARVEEAMALVGSRRVTMAQVRAFLAVADSGSYVAASQRTGLSQPTLHRAIGDLSLILRRTLVERRGRGITLTETGRRTARDFRLARTELEVGISEVLANQDKGPLRITVGAMPVSRARVLPTALASFYLRHPDVEVVVVEGSHGELVEPLRDGSVDLMIGALRDPPPGPDLQQRALFEDQPIVLARAGHPLAAMTGQGEKPQLPPLAQLARFPWIAPSSAAGSPLRAGFETIFAAQGLAPPAVPIQCGSVMIIREILMQSDFLTMLSPDQVAVELEAGWLISLGEPPGQFARTIGLTTRAQWRPSALQSAFIDALDEAARTTAARPNSSPHLIAPGANALASAEQCA